MQFWYRLGYRPKVSANLGFGFGIRPKPKYLFWSYTTDNPIVWLMNEIPHMLSKIKMLKCSFKYFSTHFAAMYAEEKMLPLLPNKAISKHVWVELIHFQILYGHELITFSCLSHFIFNYLSASLAVMVHSLVQIRFICLNWWQFSKKMHHMYAKENFRFGMNPWNCTR